MELKSLIVDSKSTWVEFPGLDGFEVELANLSRKELISLRKRCTTNKFNRKTRAFEESLDDNKFIKEFTASTVKGWKGLVENSNEFDNWLNEVVFDLENFRSGSERKDKGETDSIS